MEAEATAGPAGLALAERRVRLAWHGTPVLEGLIRTEPAAGAVAATVTSDGRVFHLSVRLTPPAGARLCGAWLDLHWAVPEPGPVALWVPHLRPCPDDVIADHAARSPVAGMQGATTRVVLLPDVDGPRPLPWAFDADRADPRGPRLSFGLTAWAPRDHVYFRRLPGPGTAEPLVLGVRMLLEAAEPVPLETACARWAWRVHGAPRVLRARTQALPWAEHAARGYRAVLADEWLRAEQDGAEIGGPLHYAAGGAAVFFSAWFNALRSAVGLALFAREQGWTGGWARAAAVARLAERMPPGPLLPTWYDHAAGRWWGVGDDLIFAWVTRDPATLRWFHLPDVCETARWMLAWNRLVAPRPDFAERVCGIGRFLAAAQREDGAVPSYFDQATLRPGPRLAAAAQSAAAGPVLLAAGEVGAAARLADFLCREVVPAGRYFDFETFFSDSWKPLDFADPYTGLPPQNTLSMAWTAAFLLRIAALPGAGEAGRRAAWLAAGRRALDTLCLYQQLWEPPFLSYRAFGGFGVMNTDAEWSDARQAQFGLLLLEAGETLGEPEYVLRGVAALRAAFALQAIPENRDIAPGAYDGRCPNWPRERVWDFDWLSPPARFGHLPAGKMVENYAHGTFDAPGIRSGFDWGEGSAATATLLARARFGDVFVDRARGLVFGLDGVNAHGTPARLEIDDILPVPWPRRLVVRDRPAAVAFP